jgi:hypothetical protein
MPAIWRVFLSRYWRSRDDDARSPELSCIICASLQLTSAGAIAVRRMVAIAVSRIRWCRLG